ncbi:MAG TPA: hypothetical protein VLR26_07990 [Frankiaceae bacterium]|nr:hypothetical protein [Frankiaceae bacterium]
MSSLSATYLVYAVVALPLVGAATWSVYRQGAPVLLDVVDADEMLVAAIHRLASVGYGLLGLGFAAALAPSGAEVRAGAVSAVVYAWAALLLVLGIAHLLTVAVFLRVRHARKERDLGPPRWYAGPGQVGPAGSPQPMFSAPPPFLPPYPPPMRSVAPAPAPPAFAPPWCTPLPPTFDPWSPPRR